MEAINFNQLLLKTAFSCMACDGDIDKREVELIKQLHQNHTVFGDIDIDTELNSLIQTINKEGYQYLKNFFRELTAFELTGLNELKLIEVAISTIKADEKVTYEEVKFFKVIRSKLTINDDQILEKNPDFEEYLEQDIISASYLSKIQDDFFTSEVLNKFQLLNNIDSTILENINPENENSSN
jgi:uncharacterized tellurite resistance protein B-like protein